MNEHRSTITLGNEFNGPATSDAMLVIAICAVLCGADWEAVAEFGRQDVTSGIPGYLWRLFRLRRGPEAYFHAGSQR